MTKEDKKEITEERLQEILKEQERPYATNILNRFFPDEKVEKMVNDRVFAVKTLLKHIKKIKDSKKGFGNIRRAEVYSNGTTLPGYPLSIINVSGFFVPKEGSEYLEWEEERKVLIELLTIFQKKRVK